MSVEVFELRMNDAPGEVWYGVRVNGRSLEAGWADPEAARRRGEAYAREQRSTRGGPVTETETPTIPEEETVPAEPEAEPETEEAPAENGTEED